jgi:hypothetical protein
MAEKNYEELVQQAETAVAPVKDPELKRIAFEKILDALLETSEANRDVSPTRGKTKARSQSSRSRANNKARSGTQAYVEELVDEDFFTKPKTIAAVKAELGNRGHHIPLTSLSGPLQRLCKKKRLRRQKGEGSDGAKRTFAYSNW